MSPQHNSTHRSPTTRLAAAGGWWAVVLAAASLPAVAEDKSAMELTPQRIQERIARYRTAEVTLTLTDPQGKPLSDKPVGVRQVAHKFLFGCNAFRIDPNDDSQAQKDYQRRYAALLNYATLPFYWGSYERRAGETAAAKLRGMARWCKANAIRTKGHPLCWHQVAPRWGGEKSLEEMHRLQIERITREVKGFAGLIDTWDVVNEAVVMPDFKRDANPISALCRKLGRLELIKQTFAAADKANPAATILLNDYDTSPRYAELIEQCLAAGVKIDVIGIQSHQHTGYWGARKAWDVCERFAKYKKPLHFTEATLISGEKKKNMRWNGPSYEDWNTTAEGEKLQAEQVVEFYTVLFSHPAVEAITWWDFSDNAWLGAPAGLVRKDMSPKPAYERLMGLVKGEWWTGEQKLRTDAGGRVSFRGYLGRYEADAGQSGRCIFVVDEAQKANLTVKLH